MSRLLHFSKKIKFFDSRVEIKNEFFKNMGKKYCKKKERK
jgi:hypothetical protein